MEVKTGPSQRVTNETEADDLIHRACQIQHATLEGERWLKMAIDPFPDEQRVCAGFPDMTSSKSIVYPLKIEKTIGAGVLGAAWDCSIAFMGFMCSTQLVTAVRAGNNFASTGQGGAFIEMGGLSVRTALAGGTLDFAHSVDSLVPTSPTNPYRVISMGIEVQNVTEPINRSGSAIAWRQPSFEAETAIANLSTLTTTAGTAMTMLRIPDIPINAAQAANLPDSKELTAEQGAYMVCVMDAPTLPVNTFSNSNVSAKQVLLTSNGLDFFPNIVGAGIPFTTSQAANSRCNYNSCGVYLSGLSLLTKLRIVYHLVIEEFPPPTNLQLSALATPSAAYDPAALVMYANAVRHLPVAVPVSENWLGAWFLSAAEAIAKWAAPKLLVGWKNDKTDEEKKIKDLQREVEVLREAGTMMRPVQKQPQKKPQPKPKPLPPIPKKKPTKK